MDADAHQLVFVGGLHRSGTTAMARLLGAHPRVSAFSGTTSKEDEGQHLQDVYPPARAYGGTGRFARDARAHLTEDSPLATPDSARRLTEQWGRHWDLSRPVLVEKSPPNLLMTRFLQQLFPTARFLIMMRHPAVVSLSTGRWRRTSTLDSLVGHWVAAHETFMTDATFLRAVHVVRYEELVRDPAQTLETVREFLDLPTAVPADALDRHRSDDYERRWRAMAHGRAPGARRRFRRMIDRREPEVRRFGYSLEDLAVDEAAAWRARDGWRVGPHEKPAADADGAPTS